MTNLLKAKSEFRKKGVTLLADKVKSGGGGSWKFAGEDNLIKTIQAPLTACGLELIITMNYLQEMGIDTVNATLYHIESGENITSTISLPIVTPKKDRNDNPLWLDAEIERGKQFGYWSRILAIRILGLSDIDAEDMDNYPQDLESKSKELEKLKKLIDESDDDKILEKICTSYKVSKIEDLFEGNLKQAVVTLERQKEFKELKDSVDMLDTSSLTNARAKLLELYSAELDPSNKAKIKAFGEEIANALKQIGDKDESK